MLDSDQAPGEKSQHRNDGIIPNKEISADRAPKAWAMAELMTGMERFKAVTRFRGFFGLW